MLKSIVRTQFPADDAGEGRRTSFAARLLRRLIGPVSHGRLVVRLPSGEDLAIRGKQPGAEADLSLQWCALRRVILDGDIGFAQAYREGDWSTSNLETLLTWATQNEAALNSLGRGWAVSRFLYKLKHALRANTRTNSRRNISAHYDLGNEFYAAWLDTGMNYSSGLYTTPALPLETAQTVKIDRIVELLELRGGERILEIGCGWGALAERLIAAHGCHVTGLTLSARQQDYAIGRLKRRKLGHLADIRLQDYRDVVGTFERIVSIEMIEAVGEAYWPTYFDRLCRCLAPEGIAVLQVITIDPERYDAYRSRPDFVQTHIFPGGMLPTPDIIEEQARRAGLSVMQVETFGASYAQTLADWRVRFNRSWHSIADLGFDERFQRLWNYYLAYCRTGFETGLLDVALYQIVPGGPRQTVPDAAQTIMSLSEASQ